MQKWKHSYNRKYFNSIIIIVAVCLIGILFNFVRHYLLTMNNYFINIDDAAGVRDIIASEFFIEEITKTEVENALNNGVFGHLDCRSFQYGGGSEISDSVIVCDALGSHNLLFPRTYSITMGFRGDVFSEIEVQSFTDVP
jgi:hypothetical protein